MAGRRLARRGPPSTLALLFPHLACTALPHCQPIGASRGSAHTLPFATDIASCHSLPLALAAAVCQGPALGRVVRALGEERVGHWNRTHQRLLPQATHMIPGGWECRVLHTRAPLCWNAGGKKAQQG